MDNIGKSRWKMLAAATATIAGVALSSTALMASASNSQSAPATQPHLRDMSKPTSVMLRIESLNPQHAPGTDFDVLTDAALGEVISLRKKTNVAAPYYFDIEVDRRTTTPSDLNFTITLYDGTGNNLGSINIGDEGTAIFKPQQIMFHVSANFA